MKINYKTTHTPLSITVIFIYTFLWSAIKTKFFGGNSFSLVSVIVIALISIPTTNYIESFLNKNKSKGE